jgi:cytochrome bd-type quinol oxidase subunit 2
MSAKGAEPARPARRWLQTAAVAYFVAATLMLVWPLFGPLGNHVEPRVMGMPWSMTYVLVIISTNFLVLVWLYRRRIVDEPSELDDESPGDGD